VAIASHGPAYGLAADENYVYWSLYEPLGSIRRCRPEDCAGTETVLASGQALPAYLQVDDQHVYWTNSGDGTVRRCAIEGCGDAPQALAIEQDEPWGLALDETHIYWTNRRGGSVMRKRK
jgi:hypothetical protein